MIKENTGEEKKMDITQIIEELGAFSLIITGLIIVIPILIIIAIFTISYNTTELNKKMNILNKKVDVLIQLEERKQGIKPNPSHIQQNYDNSGFDNRQ
ncbi:MAG: hypothetical protein ACLSHF_02445 [[Eubacterium] siraeum]|jgi:predicted PurR-regulated permease PerM